MVLGDLLEELRDNILRDRSDQVSGAQSDKLWTDKTLIRYINEAETRFALRSECLRDATTPEVCQINTTVGKDTFPLSAKIVGVLSARAHGDSIDLARTGHCSLDTYNPVDNRLFDFSNYGVLTPGKVLAFSTDEGMTADDKNSLNKLSFRTYPVVGAGYAGIINLRVVRLPLRKLRLSDLESQPEIPEQYHLNMLDWAGYLALRGPDLDVAGGDAPGRAKELAQSFEAHVTDAKSEFKRRAFSPAKFKFGGNGFSYSRDYYG